MSPFTTNANPGRSTWIFQANPAKYRIGESLMCESEELWNLNQHSKRVHAGDHVYIWISGKAAGIYATATVLCEPLTKPDSTQGLQYWWDQRDGLRAKPRVILRYQQLITDRPLLKIFLENDPDLWSLKILKNPRGTNFEVSETEARALAWWFGNGDPTTLTII